MMQPLQRLPALAILVALASAEVALAAPAPRPMDRASPTTGPDGSPLSPEDIKELQQLELAVGQFESATKDYRGTVTHIIRQEYEKKRRETLARYDDQIKQIEIEEKQRRLDAIAVFEKFLAKYPNDKRWSPDVIFRLAELYFERANDDYLAAVDATQKAADLASKDPNAPPPSSAPPTPDYQKTIDLYKRLIAEFSDYRLIDGAYYLLGYCLGEMNKEAEARQAYLALVCGNKYNALDPPAAPVPTRGRAQRSTFDNPYETCKAIKEDSRFVPEAWTRIGEYHFDSNELELAISSYARVLNYKDSPYFDKALYKLAWSYYRADKYPEAIKKFDELVMYSDAKKSEEGKEGSDLRQEAVQYLGISFAEKDWNGDGVDDPESGLARLQGFYNGRDAESHVKDIYTKLGDIYFDETEFQRAIDVYKVLLEKWPYDKDDPKIQDKIVQAYKRLRNQDKVLEETEILAKNYGRAGEWRRRNDKATVDAAAELAEQAMVTVAVEHHKGAQTLKKLALSKTPPDGVMLERVAKEYEMAAKGYENYLAAYPNSKNTYDYTFFYAETLYYSGKFKEAAEQYEKIRDSNLDNRYLEDATFNATKSLENLIAQEVARKELTLPPMPEVGKVTVPVVPIAIPDDLKHLQADYDAFATRMPTSGKVPVMTYKAAELEFKYLDFAKARPRMEAIFEKYCTGNEDIGAQAGAAIVASYTIEDNLDKILEWTEKLQKGKCGSTATAEKNGNIYKGLAQDVRFKKAQKDYDDGKFESAADQFIKLVDGDPKNTSGNNDKALNNAAVGYEKVSRFSAATKVYERIVSEYPNSPFVDDALFRTAFNYQRFFEFDKAVVSYQRLANDAKFKGSQHRTDSLYNAAQIIENDQNYNEAARLFQQYSKDPNVKREDQAEAFFRSAQILLKNKDSKRARAAYMDYVRVFGTDPKKTIEANFRIAETFEQEKNNKAAMAEYAKVAAEGSRVAPASDAAEFPAKAAFLEAEAELPKLEHMKMTGDAKQLKKELDAFTAEINKLTEMYNKVIAFRRATWALAAYFRIGYSWEQLSKNLGAVANAPCPKEVQAIEKKQQKAGIDNPDELACTIYLQALSQQIESMVAPVDEQVVKRYRATLENAAKFGASNEWTKLARQRANAYKPDEFPLTKDEKTDMQLEDPK